MAVSSLTNFTLSAHHCINPSPSPKISESLTRNLFKIPVLNPSCSGLCFHSKALQPVRNFQCPSKALTEILLLFSFPQPQKEISRVLAERVAILLLGSLIFMGFQKPRPVLAQLNQESERFERQRDVRFERSDESEEEVMCVKLVEENPRDVEALKMAVNVKIKRGKSKESVGYVERLIELQPSEMEWRLLQALCYEMIGNLSKAKSLFKNILKQQPLLLRALHGLAMVMHKNHEGPAVFEMLQKALQLAHQKKRVNEERNIRILIAQMHIIKGDFELALEKFQALIDENPRDFRPYLCQGIVYSLLDKKREAEERFEIYRSLVPDEFPQRGFLDDVVLAAKTESRQQLRRELQS